jgi:hypothetical protein
MRKSSWGDAHLFFRHNDMGADLDVHPEWEPYTPKLVPTIAGTLEASSLSAAVAKKVRSGCPFAHLFQ